MVGGFDKDFRFIAGIPKHTLDAEDFVPDCVAVTKGREHLMDADHAGRLAEAATEPSAGPLGRRATISRAGGTCARRRSSHPGAAAAGAGASSFFNRANISRYFRSMTLQS